MDNYTCERWRNSLDLPLRKTRMDYFMLGLFFSIKGIAITGLVAILIEWFNA